MKVAQYIRISTHEQNSALQRADLDKYIQDRGWQLVEVYEDVMSGAKASRPGLIKLLEDAQNRKFDVVAVRKLDRFGRSVIDCLQNIQKLEAAHVRFIATTQNLDTSRADPCGRFMLHMLAACSEFERSLIKDRVHAGMRQAKRDGKHVGRPKLIFSRDEVARLRAEGLSIREISKQMDLSIGTVSRTLAEAA
jgi:DNA invertase Pin-like site-specific DNA recombinase